MIKAQKTESFAVSLTNDQHIILSDVAKSLGGGDEGLNPHELIEAALASCTLLTLQLYARRKGWDVSSLKVKVQILKEGEETVISSEIDFGSVLIEHCQRLMEIAKKCPIHKLLVSNIRIETHAK